MQDDEQHEPNLESTCITKWSPKDSSSPPQSASTAAVHPAYRPGDRHKPGALLYHSRRTMASSIASNLALQVLIIPPLLHSMRNHSIRLHMMTSTETASTFCNSSSCRGTTRVTCATTSTKLRLHPTQDCLAFQLHSLVLASVMLTLLSWLSSCGHPLWFRSCKMPAIRTRAVVQRRRAIRVCCTCSIYTQPIQLGSWFMVH